MRIFSIGMVALFTLSGCDHTVHRLRDGAVETQQATPAFTVKPTVSSISLRVQENGSLKKSDLDSVNALLKNQGRLASQVIRIQPFSDKGDAFAARIKTSLLALGAKKENVSVQPIVYVASSGDSSEEYAGWDLSFTSEAIVVMTYDCSIQSRQTWSITPFESVGMLGCANRANLAQMVADPRDLIRGRALDHADGINAVESMTRYHESDVTPLLDIDFNED